MEKNYVARRGCFFKITELWSIHLKTKFKPVILEMIKSEFNFNNLKNMIEEMISKKNLFSHYDFCNWFQQFFINAVVHQNTKVSSKEVDDILRIDNDIDWIVDFDRLEENEKGSFIFSESILRQWFEMINK